MELKTIKKMLAAAVALWMVIVLALPAVAGDNTNTLTIKSKTTGHTFQAYQIFQGTYAEGKLFDVEWGNGVNDSGALLQDLQNENFGGSNPGTESFYFQDCVNAAQVADVICEKDGPFQDDSELLDQLADVLAQHLTSDNTKIHQSGEAVENTDTDKETFPYLYSVSGLADGYYFVKETGMTGSTVDKAYTKFMLQVADGTTIKAKSDVPTIDKTIVGNPDSLYSNAAMGDTVHFKLTSAVPAMDGYEKYFFVVHDTLAAGLTFNRDVVIKVGDTILKAPGEDVTDADYSVTLQGQQIEIVLKDFIRYKTQATAPIEVTYSATVNKDAVIGTAGNSNDVYLIYSNDPNVTATGDPGDPDKPDVSDVVGETAHKQTYTYVTGLKLSKEDPEGNPLTGAQFSLSGSSLNKVLVYEELFKEAADGTYWKLKDGTYTTTAPTNDTKDLYENTAKKYKREQVKSEETVPSSGQTKSITASVDQDGILQIDGLGAGTYTLTETKAPNGYNLLEEPIEFTLNWQAPDQSGSTACTWTVQQNGNGVSVDQNGILTLTVKNEKGITLPRTGGIGTTIFYIIGTVLVVGAGVLWLIKRYRNSKKGK